jgi:thiol-disulfide isomerase/thioredoxin
MKRKGTLCILLLVALSASAADHVAAPEFTLPTASGTIALHDYRGKVVFVDFWASWCGPCRESFPWMSTMADKYRKDGLVIVSINLDKDRDAANRFLDRYTASFPVAFDPAGRSAEAYRVQAMPSSFVVSRTGTILYAHQGFEPAKAHTLEDHIKEALSQ